MGIQQNWEYQSGKWTSIKDPLPMPDNGNKPDQHLKTIGYKKSDIEFGDTGGMGGFGLTVYTHVQPEKIHGYKWLVLLDIGYSVESIYIKRLPDLISLLRDCSTIALTTQIKHLNDAGLLGLIERLP